MFLTCRNGFVYDGAWQNDKKTAWARKIMEMAKLTLDSGSKIKKVEMAKKQLARANVTKENGNSISITVLAY